MSEIPPASTLNQRIADRALAAIAWVRNVSLAIKLILVTGGALVSGLAKFLPLETSPLDVKDVVGACGAVAAFVGAIALLFLDKNLAGSLTDAADAAAELQRAVAATARLGKRFGEAEARDARSRAVNTAYELMRDSIERSLAREPMDEAATIAELLDVALGSLQSAMSLGPDDLWTISIYRAEAGPILLRVASRRAERLEERALARQWRPGEGHIGMTFLRRDIVVLEDVADPAISHALNTPPTKHFSDDAVRYRSIASWPVTPAGEEEPWGVAIATSSIAARFSPTTGSEGWERANAMKVFAGMLALAISTHHSLERRTQAAVAPPASK